ncbi:endonuclease/exonuclease/phosphatase family protein [Spirilliplanes yamanashiensis]|uniref:endonuclease/exonuclease/phosphatase family protein n=1 Tax=Spirilliplanes yamanashiensis TaxID=42233 RepID=UPI00194EBA35|nr:endonuclease/exonuclease/phosphatase family protein [Spirilliplanes yamanashiensis]MDP9819029.1 endonuclease/exonuclease/phosphatase family metal-dependent hydrolase [Spirilliplanes yamanashiensis]
MRAGTWNLENLFRPGEAGGPADDAAYKAKLTALAGTIADAGLDLVGVQEVGSAGAAADLAAQLGAGWRVLLSERFEPRRPIRVGVLTRLSAGIVADVSAFPPPLAGVQAGDDGALTTGAGRGALAVRTAGPGAVTVIVCHLKSKLLSYPAAPGRSRFAPRDEGERARVAAYALYRRTAEAVMVRGLADAVLGGRGRTERVVLMGDLNDETGAATTQLLQGPPGSEIGTGGFDRPDAGDGARLWNLAGRIAPERRWSRVYRSRPELIDHLLVSHALLPHVSAVDALVDRPPPPSIGDDPGARRGAPGSDHAPVVATLTL